MSFDLHVKNNGQLDYSKLDPTENFQQYWHVEKSEMALEFKILPLST